MNRLVLIPMLVAALSPARVARLSAQAPAGWAESSDLFRVRTASTLTVGTLESVGVDSFRLVPRVSKPPVLLERREILSLERGGRAVHPLRGALVGAGALAIASADPTGPLAYAGVMGVVSLLMMAAGAGAPDWPAYPDALARNPGAAVAVGAATGLLLGMIPSRRWLPVSGWEGGSPEAALPPIATPRSRRKLAAEIGAVAGVAAGFLAGDGFGDPRHGTVTALRFGALGSALGFALGGVR